jgi:dihydrofolate reductase
MRSLVEVDISMSLDGFITGPDEQAAGLGRGGEPLHYWFTKDPAARELLADALFATAGAVVTSRKVYDGMNGWGESGFYRMPVFVVTHRPHEVVVKGETTFTFVTDGIESAIAQARAAADEKKVHHGWRDHRPTGPAGREGFQNAGSCCGAVVFVDQSAKSVAALDLFAARWLVRVCRLGREEPESAVRALAVVGR